MGSLGELKALELQGNTIGDKGMKAFSTAIASGSLGSLKTLLINFPSQASKDACSSREIKLYSMGRWGD